MLFALAIYHFNAFIIALCVNKEIIIIIKENLPFFIPAERQALYLQATQL